jgi:hypothetical protein
MHLLLYTPPPKVRAPNTHWIGGWVGSRASLDDIKLKTKLHGLSPQAIYTEQATAACRRSDCQLVRMEGATWSAWRIPPAVFSIL